jgi:hypothetical protein
MHHQQGSMLANTQFLSRKMRCSWALPRRNTYGLPSRCSSNSPAANCCWLAYLGNVATDLGQPLRSGCGRQCREALHSNVVQTSTPAKRSSCVIKAHPSALQEERLGLTGHGLTQKQEAGLGCGQNRSLRGPLLRYETERPFHRTACKRR